MLQQTLPERLKQFSRDDSASIGDAWNLCAEAADEIERLRAALRSIAKNTCCDRCQEAALVARAALERAAETAGGSSEG